TKRRGEPNLTARRALLAGGRRQIEDRRGAERDAGAGAQATREPRVPVRLLVEVARGLEIPTIVEVHLPHSLVWVRCVVLVDVRILRVVAVAPVDEEHRQEDQAGHPDGTAEDQEARRDRSL